MTLDISMVVVILNFVLLMIVLNSILYKPLKKYFTERQTKIENDINEANQSIERAEHLVKRREQELNCAMVEARQIQTRIKNEAELNAKEIINSAKEQEQEIIRNTEIKISEMNNQAMMSLEDQLSEIVAELAGKVLSEKIDSEKDKEMIHKLLAERGS